MANVCLNRCGVGLSFHSPHIFHKAFQLAAPDVGNDIQIFGFVVPEDERSYLQAPSANDLLEPFWHPRTDVGPALGGANPHLSVRPESIDVERGYVAYAQSGVHANADEVAEIFARPGVSPAVDDSLGRLVVRGLIPLDLHLAVLVLRDIVHALQLGIGER